MDLDSPSSDLVSFDVFHNQFRYTDGPCLELDDADEPERVPIVPTRPAAGEWCEAHRDRAGLDVAAVWIVNGNQPLCARCYAGQSVLDAPRTSATNAKRRISARTRCGIASGSSRKDVRWRLQGLVFGDRGSK